MTLPALDLLGSVVTAFLSAHARGLDRLAIHYGRAGLEVPIEPHPHPLAQGRVHLFPGSVQAPGAEVVVDGLPGWEVMGQQSPGTTALENVEDGVCDLAQFVEARTPGSFGSRKMARQTAPFGIGKVALVCSSHARHPTERVPQNPF